MSGLSKHLLQLVGIAKGWALKNLPGWSDDSHRDLLARHGGRRQGDKVSALTMTLPMLSSVLADYERRGWPREKQPHKAGNGQKRAAPPDIAHIVRLWGKLGESGRIENASRPALLKWCARQVGHDVPDLDSLTPEDERRNIIEALKGWQRR
ncbi:regulatory protein GemA [Azonexus sp.]|uniref:regulatory protein GemA n=1 Tax=Azonexus sp. TaxID=1872668 RepID=UPI0027B92FF3|nr:regulatory protein GemA [Azonexus sp.]